MMAEPQLAAGRKKLPSSETQKVQLAGWTWRGFAPSVLVVGTKARADMPRYLCEAMSSRLKSVWGRPITNPIYNAKSDLNLQGIDSAALSLPTFSHFRRFPFGKLR
jgi:hypothetical protein